MLIQYFGVEADQFLTGECVQAPSYRIDGARDVLRGAVFSSLEQHVLNEMRNAIFGAMLYPRATADPNAQRDGPNVGHCFRNYPDAVGQRGALNFTDCWGRKNHGFPPF